MATFTVSNTNDSGTGSLRQAILDANSATGADNIQFSIVSGSTITLTSGESTITDSVTIDGDIDDNNAPDITVQRRSTAGAFRIFTIDNGSTSTTIDVTIDGLVITGGSPTGNGGGIYNRENLTIKNSTIGGNTASYGGGIFNRAPRKIGTKEAKKMRS